MARTTTAGTRRSQLADLEQWASSASTWINRLLQGSVVVLAASLLSALIYLARNRDTVQVLPLTGTGDQVAVALQVGEMLAAISEGAGSGVDADARLTQTTSEPPPAVVIPGTGVPLASVIDYLERSWVGRQDRVRVALVSTDATHHRLRAQFDGYHVSARTLTSDEKPSPAEAILDGAERIYAVLRPVGAAYYFSTRDPARSLDLVDREIHRSDTPEAQDLVAADRVWALILRDQGDAVGAREKLWEAFQRATAAEQKASILVDTGYTHGVEADWTNAVGAFRQALHLTPASKIAKSRLGMALVELGRLDEAEHAFREAIALDSHWAEPWRGLAQVARLRWNLLSAREFYQSARRESFSSSDRALADRELGDLYVASGCVREGRALYQQAARIESCYAGPGGEVPCRGTFGDVDATCALPALTFPLVG